MDWLELTEDHLKTGLTGVELDLIKSTLLAEDQDDPVPATLENAVNEARGFIAGGGIELGAADTIPDRLVSHVVARAVVILIDRVPALIGTLDPEGSRRKRSDEALSILRDVMKGNFSISDPTTDAESTTETAKPIYRPRRKRTTTRSQQEGL